MFKGLLLMNQSSKNAENHKYEAHPQSMFPWGRLQKQNIISWKYLLQQIQ
jgi:hypothetical protein